MIYDELLWIIILFEILDYTKNPKIFNITLITYN